MRIVYQNDQLSPELSLVFMCLYLLGVIVFAILFRLRARARAKTAREAELSVDPERPLAAGPTVVVGMVEHAADETMAVRVEVEQRGTEDETSGSWSHKWTEVGRHIFVRPFYLRTPNGERVRVNAPTTVEVADSFDGKVLISRAQRKLIAELTPGECVYAVGTLQLGKDPESEGQVGAVGYRRHGGQGWELVPTRGKMLLSSEPLGARWRRRARFHYRCMWLVVSLGLVWAIAMGGYVYRLTLGYTASLNVYVALLLLGLAVCVFIGYHLHSAGSQPWYQRRIYHGGRGRASGRGWWSP